MVWEEVQLGPVGSLPTDVEEATSRSWGWRWAEPAR